MLSSLRVRLTLLFVVLTIAPLFIAGVSITQRGFAALQNQAVELQNQLADRTAVSLGAFFNERRNELTVLTDVYGLTSLDNQAQKSILATILAKQDAYYELVVVNGQGQETIRVVRGEIITDSNLADRTDDPVFQDTVTTGTVNFRPVYFNERARDRLITMAIPIVDLFTGEISYVLMAEIRFQNVQETLLRDIELGAGEDVYILDSTGTVIAHRNPNLVIRETTFTLPDAGGRYTGLTGGDVILARQPLQLENLELTVVAEVPYATATALAFETTNLARTITLITLLTATIIVVLVVTQAVRPITKIASVAQAIQGGDLTARADETGSTEIATLGLAFNGMTRQLRTSLQGLQENVEQLKKSQVERENLIKDLQAAKRLAEENSRLKSEFLATMSHELRTPMNAIEGFTSIMLKKMGGVEYNEKAERFLNKVQSNSQRLLNLINDFLDLSRIESGRLELANLPVSPAELAKKWQNELSVLAENKGITFEVSVDPNLPATFYGDEESLSKVAVNLLGNAFKFTSEGKVTLKLEKRDLNLAIEVTDTGIGIPPHAREFIFDEFRQVDQSSKREYGGTGLGLAIVQKLTREMGGTVTVDSEVGKGSTFTVLVPMQTEKAVA